MINFTEIPPSKETWWEMDFIIETRAEYFKAIRVLLQKKIRDWGCGYDFERRISTDNIATQNQIREILLDKDM
jgi:hypothetical protein